MRHAENATPGNFLIAPERRQRATRNALQIDHVKLGNRNRQLIAAIDLRPTS